ncbi:enoyl-CoA hydratase/isomerase family protein [Mycobacterium sp. NPDC048908]|uniref:enoyl-CoA hydratase/isomerase family protein n=1 Tax=Mycobacterium sp. NPDC048908 TaxID=3364292 RepID=UPI00371F8F13
MQARTRSSSSAGTRARSVASTPTSTSGWRTRGDRLPPSELPAARARHGHHDQPAGAHDAIGPQTHSELVDAWSRFRDDDAALVGVLTGAGQRAFSAGGDLKAAFGGELDVDASPDEGVLGPSRWTDIYKPTIAAVNGVAYAGGLEWACWAVL